MVSDPPPTSPLLPFSPFCAIARNPLNPADLAFVPFGIVKVRIRVREFAHAHPLLAWPQSGPLAETAEELPASAVGIAVST